MGTLRKVKGVHPLMDKGFQLLWYICMGEVQLFEDEEIDDGSLNVIKASRSESAQSKERKKRNQENFPVHSFRTLYRRLGDDLLEYSGMYD
jgi:hypothetical protein